MRSPMTPRSLPVHRHAALAGDEDEAGLAVLDLALGDLALGQLPQIEADIGPARTLRRHMEDAAFAVPLRLDQQFRHQISPPLLQEALTGCA